MEKYDQLDIEKEEKCNNFQGKERKTRKSAKFAYQERGKSLSSQESSATSESERHREMKRRETTSFLNKVTLYFGSDRTHENYVNQTNVYGDNTISTTKYNVLTWFPKSLLMQFKRIANIYFLMISILTCLPLSPKSPYSQIFTFTLVILFSMIKEAVEDFKRYRMDNEINNKWTSVFDYNLKNFTKKHWHEILVGDLVKIYKDEPIPADVFVLKSSFKSGLSFVDTKDLDGETNLKEKMVSPEFNTLDDVRVYTLTGTIQCDPPNAYMDSWEGNVFIDEPSKIVANSGIKQLLLKGSILRNTDFIIGLVVYCGHNTKIMKNAKAPPIKMSNVMKVMNKLLISVFIFQILICAIFSIANFVFRMENNKYVEVYIPINQKVTFSSLIGHFFTFLVAYSQVIPISLYVAMEIVKLFQSWFVFYDSLMYDKENAKPAQAKTSELIEELGQVEFIFSDKTGTLTQNSMEFKKCYIAGKTYGDTWEEDVEDNEEGDEEANKKIPQNIHSKELNRKSSSFKFNINGDPSAYKVLSNGPFNYESMNPEKKGIVNFFMVTSICHSAICEKESFSGNLKYSSSSPDEIALLQGARNMGYTFVNRTTDTIEVMNTYSGKLEVWEVLCEIPFDSNRKRMSLIVKNKEDGDDKSKSTSDSVYILSKGADNIMIPRIKMDENEKQSTNDALYKFSCEGLRTLVLGLRSMDINYYSKWNERYRKAKLILNNEEKEEILNNLFEEIEKDLTLAGVSAIEDKLQEGVPETIELLIKSEIRLWVLTGDKKETSLIIGRTCRLIEEIGRNDIDLTFSSLIRSKEFTPKQMIENKLDELIKRFHLGHITDVNEIKKINLGEMYYMITCGTTLIEILKCPELSYKFFKVGLLCRSVICCRVSPFQKSQVVAMAKGFGSWVTLAIGDGANDVPMIMEAHIGVGIQGKEGTQAVRSSDYALCKFKYLQRLVLVHGRNGYRRISAFICYYFYKNIILVFAEIYFVFFSAYSGQIFFPDMLSILYNSLWTSWPCIFAFSIEKDIKEDTPKGISHLHYKNNLIGKNFEIIPIFYQAGQKGVYFNIKVFWKWLTYAILHGGLCYISVMVGLRYISIFDNGKLVDHWWKSALIFTMILHVVTYKIFVELFYWNYLVISTAFVSLVFYYFCIFILDVPMISMLVQNELTAKVTSMFQSRVFWIYVVTLPFMCILCDLIFKFLTKFAFPTPVDLIELDKIEIKSQSDVNIIKKLSTLLNPKAVYLNRKSGYTKDKSFSVVEEKPSITTGVKEIELNTL